MVDGPPGAAYACAFSSIVLACSTAGTEPFVPTLMASTPRLSSREAGMFTAGQVIPADVLAPRGPTNPSSGAAAPLAPAGHRPGAGTDPWCAHATNPAAAGLGVGGGGAGGDQRGGAAGPPGHDPGRGHGGPRARDGQADDHEQDAGKERPDLTAGGCGGTVHDEEAERGQAGQQRQHPPGP